MVVIQCMNIRSFTVVPSKCFHSTSILNLDTGIWVGMHTVRYFDGKTYEWVGLSRQPSIMGKVCSIAQLKHINRRHIPFFFQF